MKHEKIIRRDDGSKVRIIVELRVELFRDSHSWEFSVDLCQKGKRTWLSSCDIDVYQSRRMEAGQFAIAKQKAALKYVSEQEVELAMLELWEKIRPKITITGS